ncbi:hypothetical protein EXIGLDRAFT_209282 [Exidia glandulosa HHB12029]|uniref:F-box domain-containing protein n=1 Tax=Exidia glandulosa HHB12029 TaxID=1314781 RepID=A0A165EJX2_EXIGL|nr:hypothetical protein EXIGLDRAFT_209282 [Exidia glandulosa HHB12029]
MSRCDHDGRSGGQCFGRLPQELVLHIFDFARLDHGSALSLCRVSRAVAAFVRPVLFRTVVLSSIVTTDNFLYALRAGDKAFFARHVKNLFVADGLFELMFRPTDAGVKAIWSIVQACRGLERIVAPVVWLARLERRATENKENLPCPALRHIVLTRTRQPQIQPDFGKPLFRSLTRLFIQSHYYVWLPDAMLVSTETFPALSHLAVLHIQFQDPVTGEDSDDLLVDRLPAALELPALSRLMICCNNLATPHEFVRSLSVFKDNRIRVVTGFLNSGDILPEFRREGDEWWNAGMEVYPAH